LLSIAIRKADKFDFRVLVCEWLFGYNFNSYHL
jgi:hypothetical protein